MTGRLSLGAWREASGLALREVAEMTGLSVTRLHNLETGAIAGTLHDVAALHRASGGACLHRPAMARALGALSAQMHDIASVLSLFFPEKGEEMRGAAELAGEWAEGVGDE